MARDDSASHTLTYVKLNALTLLNENQALDELSVTFRRFTALKDSTVLAVNVFVAT